MDFPKLYKTNSNGKELEWSICTYYKEDWIISTVHGQVDGAMQIAETVIKKGKNIGRANETTAEQQANSEAESKWKKQLDKGYSESRGGASKTARPMLAHKYEDHKDKIVFPCYLQSKLDGHRCVAIKSSDSITLMTRGCKEYLGLNHIKKELFSLMKDSEIWDGEIFNPDLTFQEMTSLIKKPCKESEVLEYRVYDCILPLPFIERIKRLKGSGQVKVVRTIAVNSHEDIKKYHEDCVAAGFEGAMVRHGNEVYKEGTRSSQLLKVKSWQDAEFKIIDVIPGVGKMHNQGIFVCVHDGTLFNVRSKGEDALRREYLKNKKKYIGKDLTVKFFEWTTSEKPLPRFPVGLQIREDFDK